MKIVHYTLLFIIPLSFVSCASTATREEVEQAARASLPDIPDAWTAAQETIGDVEVHWIAGFQDETLVALVREAQENNKSLQAAAANVERSWGLAKQAGAALKPNLDLTAGRSRSGTVDSSRPDIDSFSVGLQVNWELDVWGRIRAGKEAASAGVEAAEADYRYSQHSLAAAVARAYFLAIEAGLQTDVARRTFDALTETHRIVDVRYKNGLGSSQDIAVSKSDLATAQAALSAMEGSRRDALRALEVLLGRYPAADLDVRDSLPDVPPPPPAGVPSEILERRPDIVAAERQIAVAFNRVDQAKAARLPAIGLTSSIGGASSELSSLLDPANLAWRIGSSLLAPLFDGGARAAQIEISTAEQKQTIAAYGQVALDAFRDIETYLDQSVVLGERNAALNEAAEEALKALHIAQLRFAEGESDLLDVLAIQQRVFATENNLVALERARLDQRINLNLALGGSWE